MSSESLSERKRRAEREQAEKEAKEKEQAAQLRDRQEQGKRTQSESRKKLAAEMVNSQRIYDEMNIIFSEDVYRLVGDIFAEWVGKKPVISESRAMTPQEFVEGYQEPALVSPSVAETEYVYFLSRGWWKNSNFSNTYSNWARSNESYGDLLYRYQNPGESYWRVEWDSVERAAICRQDDMDRLSTVIRNILNKFTNSHIHIAIADELKDDSKNIALLEASFAKFPLKIALTAAVNQHGKVEFETQVGDEKSGKKPSLKEALDFAARVYDSPKVLAIVKESRRVSEQESRQAIIQRLGQDRDIKKLRDALTQPIPVIEKGLEQALGRWRITVPSGAKGLFGKREDAQVGITVFRPYSPQEFLDQLGSSDALAFESVKSQYLAYLSSRTSRIRAEAKGTKYFIEVEVSLREAGQAFLLKVAGGVTPINSLDRLLRILGQLKKDEVARKDTNNR